MGYYPFDRVEIRANPPPKKQPIIGLEVKNLNGRTGYTFRSIKYLIEIYG